MGQREPSPVHEREEEKEEETEVVRSGIFHEARWLRADAETEVVILAEKKENKWKMMP